MVREEHVSLSRLIDFINQRFGGELNEADQLFFDQIAEAASQNESLQKAAEVNSLDKFQLVFRQVLESLFIERMDLNEELFTDYMGKPDVQELVSKWLGSQVSAGKERNMKRILSIAASSTGMLWPMFRVIPLKPSPVLTCPDSEFVSSYAPPDTKPRPCRDALGRPVVSRAFRPRRDRRPTPPGSHWPVSNPVRCRSWSSARTSSSPTRRISVGATASSCVIRFARSPPPSPTSN
jgi:hypothetical protein